MTHHTEQKACNCGGASMADVHAFHMLITVSPSPIDNSLGTRGECATLVKVADSRVHLDRAKLSSAQRNLSISPRLLKI